MKVIPFQRSLKRIGKMGFSPFLLIFMVTWLYCFGEQKSAQSLAVQTTKTNTEDVPTWQEIRLPPSDMQSTIERFALDRTGLLRSYPVEPSPARRSRFQRFYSQWLDTLTKQNFEGMSQAEQIDYLLFANHLRYEIRQLEIQAAMHEETTPLLPFAQTIADLEEARRRMEWVDSAKAAVDLNQLNRQVEAARKAVEAGLRAENRPTAGAAVEGAAPVSPIKTKKTTVHRAVATLNSLRQTLRNWFTFYNGYDPLFTWWVETPYKTVDKTLQDYSSFLRERILGLKPAGGESGSAPTGVMPSPMGFGGRLGRSSVQAEAGSSADIIGSPIGREALLNELAHEMIPYTPEELIDIANQEFAWCENEMRKASRELGHGDEWAKALEQVKTLYVEPGKQPELIRNLAMEAIRFVEEHDLVTIPPLAKEIWRMEMMSPERQLVNPFFTGGEVLSVSYPTNTMTQEQKMMSMRGNNIHFSRATVFHEIIPGHHLQGFMTARYRSYRGLFASPFSVEGWALHWEMLFWDLGFPQTPENRIGMLFWRMHRCARIIFSLLFHLEKMTPQECIDFLIKRVGHEPENAVAEVRRSFDGSYGPLYQAAYLLGGLQLRALHQELVGAGKMTQRAFHDAVLKENRIPIEMLRVALTKQKPKRNYVADWKFYRANHSSKQE